MLPGHIAGHYPRDALEIDLVRLARFAGARLVLGRASAIDRAARTITVGSPYHRLRPRLDRHRHHLRSP
jgi:selenide, water dikinase